MTPALCAGAPSTDETDGKALDRVVVGTALNQLQPLDREAIVKAYYLGFTTRRIAEDQGVTESVVMSRLHAALSVLRLTVENGLGSRWRKPKRPDSHRRLLCPDGCQVAR